MKNLLIFLLFSFTIISCDPAKHIARILKRNPGLVKTDTIWKKDTIVTSAVSSDSTFRFYQTDTIFVRDGKLTVKYVFNKDSTVYIQGKCDADTIIKYYPVSVSSLGLKDPLTSAQKFKLWVWDYGWFISGISILILLLFLKVKGSIRD